MTKIGANGSKYSFSKCLLIVMLFFLGNQFALKAQQTVLSQNGIAVIPYPKEVKLTGTDFVLDNSTTIVIDKNTTPNDQFAVAELLK